MTIRELRDLADNYIRKNPKHADLTIFPALRDPIYQGRVVQGLKVDENNHTYVAYLGLE